MNIVKMRSKRLKLIFWWHPQNQLSAIFVIRSLPNKGDRPFPSLSYPHPRRCDRLTSIIRIWRSLSNTDIAEILITGGTTREPEPGDLLFFTQKGKGSPDHVAVLMGGRQAVSLSNRPYSTIQRVTVDQLYFNNSGDAYIQIGTSITQVIKRLYF
jgi:hypothetical protein